MIGAELLRLVGDCHLYSSSVPLQRTSLNIGEARSQAWRDHDVNPAVRLGQEVGNYLAGSGLVVLNGIDSSTYSREVLAPFANFQMRFSSRERCPLRAKSRRSATTTRPICLRLAWISRDISARMQPSETDASSLDVRSRHPVGVTISTTKASLARTGADDLNILPMRVIGTVMSLGVATSIRAIPT